jgi:hypothetical protein
MGVPTAGKRTDLSDCFCVPHIRRPGQISSMFNSLDQCKIDRQLYAVNLYK